VKESKTCRGGESVDQQMNDTLTLTYQSRLPLDEKQQEILTKYASFIFKVLYYLKLLHSISFAKVARMLVKGNCSSRNLSIISSP